MTKFNVGDKVRVIAKDHAYFKEGHIFNVARVDGVGDVYDKEDICVLKSRVELFIEEVKPTKNQRINALEKEVSELKLIVHELRDRPQFTTVVNNIQESSATNTVEDIIEFEGQKYRKVERKAREGDYVSVSFANGKCFKPNKIYGPVFADNALKVKADPSSGGEFEVTSVYNNFYGRTIETVDVYELIKSKSLTPNQQRAETIKKAKAFVKNIVGEYDTFNTTIGKYKNQCVRPIFHVNEKKRAITVLIYSAFGKQLIFKGLTKCNPEEVFNEHIGKAIALGRALNLDVSEFEQAVQPTEFAVGQIIRTTHMALDDHEIIRIKGNNAYFMDSSSEEFHYMERAKDGTCKIINDTNAQYEVNSNE
ncbi:hypothetical protein ACIQZG_08570 [Lysinibacillus sp. NPDC096418]|uniref:hypothetical protein n=1 Tax=Lysinibacillus sp. NPDC096418 TaxID=3364138 RepID=UPI003826137C